MQALTVCGEMAPQKMHWTTIQAWHFVHRWAPQMLSSLHWGQGIAFSAASLLTGLPQ